MNDISAPSRDVTFSKHVFVFLFVHLLWVDNNYNTLRVRQMPIINVDSSIIYTFLLFLVDSFKVDCNTSSSVDFCWNYCWSQLPCSSEYHQSPKSHEEKSLFFLTGPEAHGVVKGRWLAS